MFSLDCAAATRPLPSQPTNDPVDILGSGTGTAQRPPAPLYEFHQSWPLVMLRSHHNGKPPYFVLRR